MTITSHRHRIESIDEIKKGDHISIKRWRGAYSHHMIAVEDGSSSHSENKLRVIHYKSGSHSQMNGFRCGFAKVRESTEKLDPAKNEINLHRFMKVDDIGDESDEILYRDDEVIRRARQRLEENEYSLETNNCEHFATWCSLGKSKSEQLEKSVLRRSLASFFEEFLLNRIARTVTKIISRSGFKGIICGIEKATLKTQCRIFFKESAKQAGRGLRATTGMAVGVAVLVDGAFMAYDLWKIWFSKSAERLSRRDKMLQTWGAVGKGVGGAVVAIAGAVLGQALFPGPGAIIGGFVGGIVGSLLGRFVREIGRMVHRG